MKALLLASISLIAGIAYGRLGETETECDIRHNKTGKAHEQKSTDKQFPLKLGMLALLTRSYDYEGWHIRIGYLNSIAYCIEYTKKAALSENEIAAVLEANGGTPSWRRIHAVAAAKQNERIASLALYCRCSRFCIRRDGAIAFVKPFIMPAVLRVEGPEAVALGIEDIKRQGAEKTKPIPDF